MNVITIESQAFQELMAKVNSIARFVIRLQEQDTASGNPDEEWVDSYEVCTFLNISARTLQRLRSKKIISYSVISGKSYYQIAEIRRLLQEKRIRTREEALENLIENHKQHVEQRKLAKAERPRRL